MFVKFGLRKHRGSLENSLKTVEFVSYERFLSLIRFYDFYAFDSRCNQLLFLVRGCDLVLPEWLFIQFSSVD